MRAFPLAVKRGWWDNRGPMTASSSPPRHSSRVGIGKPLRRLEDVRLLTGRGCYSDDFNVAGQAYAVVVRSPQAHARIAAIETQHARAMPDVIAVLTGASPTGAAR